MKKLLTLLFILFPPCVLMAQKSDSSSIGGLSSAELSMLSLDDILNIQVVTVTRTAQKSSDAPASIIIVTEEQIRARGYQSLLEVFQDLPDVKVETNNDPRWQHDVQIRGVFGMDKFIILLDGVRISSPTNDIIPIMENYPVNSAKQIEVVYGPASALYGADALSGVVNIISKRAGDFKNGVLQGTALGGMYSTFTGNIATGFKFSDMVSLTVSGQYFYDRQPELDAVRNFTFQSPAPALQSFNGQTARDFLQRNAFPTDLGFPQSSTQPLSGDISNPLSAYGIHAALQVEDLRLTFFRNQSYNPSTTANKPNNTVYNTDSFFGHAITMGNATYSKFLNNNLNSTTYLIYSQYDLDNRSNFRNAFTGMNTAYLFSFGRMFKVEQLLSWSASNQFTLTGGATYENFFSVPRGHDLQSPITLSNLASPIVNSVGLPNAPNGVPARIFELSYNNIGVYVQGQYAPVEQFTLTVGARIDRDSRFGVVVNPRLGAVLRVSERTVLKALLGSAFLAPSPLSAYDEFGTFFNAGGTTRSAFFRLANPDLGPQRIVTAELGFRAALTSDINLSISGYFNRLNGLFSQTAAVPAGVYPGNPNTPSPVDGFYPDSRFAFPVDFLETIVNQGNQTNFGGTIQLDYTARLGSNGRLIGYVSASVIDGLVEVANATGALVNRQIGGISPLMLRTGADITIEKLTVSPRLIFASPQRTHPQQGSAFDPNDETRRQVIPGYLLLNMTARYQLFENLSLFVRGQNLLNQNYRTINLGAGPLGLAGSAAVEFPDGAPQNPIRVTGGVQFNF